MRSIEEIKGRCVIELDAKGKEHWIWAGCYQDSKKGDAVYSSPVLRAPDFGRDPTGKKTWTMYGSRAVFMLDRRRPPRAGFRAVRTCHHHGCMHPDCVKEMKPSTSTQLAFDRARPQRQAHWRDAALRGWDAKGRQIPDETVLAAISTPGTCEEVAKELGIDLTTVSRYRRGELRSQTLRKEAGMFAGLLQGA